MWQLRGKMVAVGIVAAITTTSVPATAKAAADDSRAVCDALDDTLWLISDGNWEEARASMDAIDGLTVDLQRLLGTCPNPSGRPLNMYPYGSRWTVTVNLDVQDWWIGFGVDAQGTISLPHVRAK